MGFIKNDNEEISITAKLTTYGRKQLLGGNNMVKYFSLGDSDANYYTEYKLGNGKIPTMSGDINNNLSVLNDYVIKNEVIVNDLGHTKKLVETTSNNINSNKIKIPKTTIDTSKISNLLVNRNDNDENVNLLYSLGLPITETDKTIFNSVNNKQGGFGDTALKTINNDKTLLISMDNDVYGEVIDGKSLMIIVNGRETFEIYGTFQKNLTPLQNQDNKLKEDTNNSKVFGENVIFLFSDQVKKPNGDSTKTWSTGYGKIKPYSLNKRGLFNLTSNDVNGLVKDECVGVAYLDKGIIAITHSDIVDTYENGISTIEITLASEVTSISQDVTCIVGRGEFIGSTNKTFNDDEIRVSEIGIYDFDQNLIAIAKTNKHFIINKNDLKIITVKITV